MKKKSVKLAKLTKPRLYGAARRTRLVALFDAAAGRSAIWVAGPPGCRKTTVVASYLDARAKPHLWCQLDGGDREPATLFYYLAELGKQFGNTKLPYLTPEYLSDIAGFSRCFFRQLFSSMPEGARLVFDSYHAAACDWSSRDLPRSPRRGSLRHHSYFYKSHGGTERVRSLCSERRSSDCRVGTVQLTAEEAVDIADARTPEAAAVASELHRRSNGWVAGLKPLLWTHTLRTPRHGNAHRGMALALQDPASHPLG